MFNIPKIINLSFITLLTPFFNKVIIVKIIRNLKQKLFKNINKKYFKLNKKINKKENEQIKKEFFNNILNSIKRLIKNIKINKTTKKIINKLKKNIKFNKITKKIIDIDALKKKEEETNLLNKLNNINNEIKLLFEINNHEIKELIKDEKKKNKDDMDKEYIDYLKSEILKFNYFLKIENELRNIRKLNIDVIYQVPSISNKTDDIIDEERFKKYNEIDTYISYILLKANRILYSNNEINNALCQIFYYTFVIEENQYKITSTKFNKKPIIFKKDISLEDINKNIIKDRIKTESSKIIKLAVGYRLIIETKSNSEGEKQILKENTIYELKAYNASNDRKYHDLTTRSTTNNKICIYETFLILNDMMDIKYNTKNNNDFIMKMFHNEDTEIKKSLKEGLLIKSLELLNRKYNIKNSIIFFYHYNLPHIILKNDKINEISNIKNGTKIYLYDSKKEHVAPSIYDDTIFNDSNNSKLFQKITNEKYILKPTIIKNKKESSDILNNCLIYDIETFLDDEFNSIPYCCCLYGYYQGELINISFYGLDSINNFIDYINKNILVNISHTSTRPNKKITYVKIYGFNNSRFDNIFIYKKLYDIDKSTKFIFAGSSIKYIEYNNISFYDLALIYSGVNLRKLAQDMKVNNTKGIFPYTFVNKNNLYYNGNFPDENYFNKKDFDDKYNYEKLKNDNENKFNVKDYTIKYCIEDCKTTFDILKKYILSTTGIINDRIFDISCSKTASGLAMKIFNQVFQSDNLEGSPIDVLKREQQAYYGGRTEVFKKYFNISSGKKLNYFDINSSYPFSMTQLMPYQYKRTIIRDFNTKNKEDIINTHLYTIIEYNYIGKDKNLINNLIERNEKGFNYSVKNYKGMTTHWGVEIREAIDNNFEFKITSYDVYDTKKVFESYVNYFYNERLKIKKTNPSLSTYYKILLNSLYGKFGQRQFDNNEICNNTSQIWNIMKGGVNIITGIEDIDEKIFMVSYEQKGDSLEYIGNLVRFSSYISAFSRTNLAFAMRSIGYDNIYYCDTDSIFTTGKLPVNLISDDILGKWKKENQNDITEAIFTAPKVYYYRTCDIECKKSKGIKSENLIKIDYENMLNNKIVKQTNNMFFRNLNGVKIRPQERNIKEILNKRNFNKNDSTIFNDYDEYINYKNINIS